MDSKIAAALPTGKRFETAAAERYQPQRERMEHEWLGELRRIMDVHREELPVFSDVDFLYGPKDAAGRDSYFLCEINASSTFAFPEFAMPAVVKAALAQIASREEPAGADRR